MGFKMNIYIGWLFKLIPLLMGIICIALGEFVLTGSGQSEYFVAGHVLISLSAICLALFTTAFIIISQLTHGMNKFYNRLFPVIGYAGSATTMIWGWSLLASNNVMADEFVAGHVIFGVGMIAACVSTVAASSGHFLLIPKNASGSKSDGTPLQAYSSTIGNSLIAVPVLLTLFGFIWSVILLRSADNGNLRLSYWPCRHYCPSNAEYVLSERTLAVVLLGYFAWLTYHYFWYLRINQFRCKRPPGPRHYSHLPGDDLLQYFLQSVVVSAGMATHMFVSQQNTHDSGIYLSVLSVPCCVPG